MNSAMRRGTMPFLAARWMTLQSEYASHIVARNL